MADIPSMTLEAQPPTWAIGRHTTLPKHMYVSICKSDLSFVKGFEAQKRIRARTGWSGIAQELSQKALFWLSESSELLGFILAQVSDWMIDVSIDVAFHNVCM